jgi:hypothetical protein
MDLNFTSIDLHFTFTHNKIHSYIYVKIYQFPIIKDADYIVLAPRDSYYPIDSASYFTLTDSLQRSPIWKTIKKNEHFILFKRK